jgi:hypothetical protein
MLFRIGNTPKVEKCDVSFAVKIEQKGNIYTICKGVLH